jgi:hypothetical protein
MIPPHFAVSEENILEAESALATLYNNQPSAGNRFLFFFLIVCTFALYGAWKTRPLLCIPGKLARWAEVSEMAFLTGQSIPQFCV